METKIYTDVNPRELEQRAGFRITPHQYAVMMRQAAQIAKLFEGFPVMHMDCRHIRLTMEIVLDSVRRVEEVQEE